jgi:hypothetical protein
VIRPVRPTCTSIAVSLLVRVSAGNLYAIAHRGARLDEPATSRSPGSSALTTAPSMSKPSVPRAAPIAAMAAASSSIVAHRGIPAGEPAVVATPSSAMAAIAALWVRPSPPGRSWTAYARNDSGAS